jgi:hypothetical protein
MITCTRGLSPALAKSLHKAQLLRVCRSRALVPFRQASDIKSMQLILQSDRTPAAYVTTASLSHAARETQLSGVRPCAGARIMTNSMARATSWWGTVRNVRQTPQSRPSKASRLYLTFPLFLRPPSRRAGKRSIAIVKRRLRKATIAVVIVPVVSAEPRRH